MRNAKRSGVLALAGGVFVGASMGVCGIASAQVVTFEVDYAGGLPDGRVTDVPIFDPWAFDVYVYADMPGVRVTDLFFNLSGRETGEFPLTGGLGTIDPDRSFASFLVLHSGALDADGMGISSVFAFSIGPSVELPVGPQNAFRLYAGVEAFAASAGASLIATDVQARDQNMQPLEVRSIGVVETPAPGTVGVLALGGVLASRRRR